MYTNLEMMESVNLIDGSGYVEKNAIVSYATDWEDCSAIFV